MRERKVGAVLGLFACTMIADLAQLSLQKRQWARSVSSKLFLPLQLGGQVAVHLEGRVMAPDMSLQHRSDVLCP
jgi:hypothetical protein